MSRIRKSVFKVKSVIGAYQVSFRNIYETELEDAATKILNLDEFDADVVKSRVALILIDNSNYIEGGSLK